MDTEFLKIRPLVSEDQERTLDILTDSTVSRTYMLPDFVTREDALPLFNRLMTLSNDPDRFVRCIAIGTRAVGFLNDVEIKGGTIELGYVIHPDSQGRGCMTEALKLAITELFERGYKEVVCGAFEENKASIHVMEKCGMLPLEHADTITYRGRTHRCIYYHTVKRKEI